MASDMAEVSWLSLTRDIAFREYESNPLSCWHRRRSLDKRELVSTSDRFIVACGPIETHGVWV
jgi:hypothetical protein